MIKKNKIQDNFNSIILLFLLLLFIIIFYFYFYKKIFLKEKFNNKKNIKEINNQEKKLFEITIPNYQMGKGNTDSEGKIDFKIPFEKTPFVFIQPQLSNKDITLINIKNISVDGFEYKKSKMIKDPSGLTGITNDNKSNFQWIAYKQK